MGEGCGKVSTCVVLDGGGMMILLVRSWWTFSVRRLRKFIGRPLSNVLSLMVLFKVRGCFLLGAAATGFSTRSTNLLSLVSLPSKLILSLRFMVLVGKLPKLSSDSLRATLSNMLLVESSLLEGEFSRWFMLSFRATKSFQHMPLYLESCLSSNSEGLNKLSTSSKPHCESLLVLLLLSNWKWRETHWMSYHH